MKKQLKTLLMSTVCLFAAQSASAQDIYIGGTVGVGALETSFRADNLVNDEFHKAHGGGTSFLGGGIIGIDYTFCGGFYTALEGRALWQSTNRNIRETRNEAGVLEHKVNVRNNLIYGGDLKIGYTIDCCCVTPYLLGGVEVGKWKTKIRNNTETPRFGLEPFGRHHFNKQRCAPKVGLGVRFPICDVLAADFQYSFSWFSRSRHHLTDPFTGFEWRNKSHIDQHKFMISLNYVFSFFDSCCNY